MGADIKGSGEIAKDESEVLSQAELAFKRYPLLGKTWRPIPDRNSSTPHPGPLAQVHSEPLPSFDSLVDTNTSCSMPRSVPGDAPESVRSLSPAFGSVPLARKNTAQRVNMGEWEALKPACYRILKPERFLTPISELATHLGA